MKPSIVPDNIDFAAYREETKEDDVFSSKEDLDSHPVNYDRRRTLEKKEHDRDTSLNTSGIE